MNRYKLLAFLAGSFFALNAQNTPAEFSLQGAIDYALKHNATYLNSEADAKYNTYKKNEVLGQGLPQLNASVDVRDNLTLPTSLIPLSAFNPLAPKGTFAAARFGVQYSSTASLTASQLIFNSSYIVGLQASKELINLSQKNIQRSKAETVQNVSKAYYGVLVTKERLKLLDLNIDRVKTLKDNTTALNQNGFVEKIDLDRLEVNYNNLITEKEKVTRLAEMSEILLKFQMGYDLNQPVKLTDNLDKAVEAAEISGASNETPDVSKRPEIQVIESQLKLNEYDLKRYRLSYLPTLAAFGQWSSMFQSNKLDFASKSWYPFAIIGATLNIGIFDGLQTNARIQQSKINVLKTKNNYTQLKSSMEMEAKSSLIALKNATASLEVQKKNIELARSIFDTAKKKYEQGVGSSLELNTAENDLRQAETNYYNSLYDVIVAKIDYQKSTGTLVK